MTPAVIFAVTAYSCGAALWAVAWGVSWDIARDRGRGQSQRTAARMLVLTPVWPAMLLLTGGCLAVEVWHDTEWGRRW